MIKISNVNVYGLEESIVASGFPMMDMPPTEEEFNVKVEYLKQTKDYPKRANKLGATGLGEGHDNFLNGIIVQYNMTFSNKMSVELQRYHFHDFVSSMSTMHRITKMDLKDMFDENVDERVIDIIDQLQQQYMANPTKENKMALLFSNPAGFEMMARFTTNYRQLKTIYMQRRAHQLQCWQDWCDWVETLPMFKELCLKAD